MSTLAYPAHLLTLTANNDIVGRLDTGCCPGFDSCSRVLAYKGLARALEGSKTLVAAGYQQVECARESEAAKTVCPLGNKAGRIEASKTV